jgi:MYXO-CTERM domain-containing protein
MSSGRDGAALEVADGTSVRATRVVDWRRVPAVRQRAWAKLVAEIGPGWQASWDRATGVPSRIFGAGLAAPGVMADAAVAAAFARGFLARHIDLLAPGARPEDFTLAANDRSGGPVGGLRTVGFFQHRDGLRVLGGQVSFRFKNDRLFVIASEALPGVSAAPPQTAIDVDRALASARQWILADRAARVQRGTVDGPFVLPLIGNARVHGYRTVVRVTLPAQEPIGRWEVFVDAGTGQPVARRQTLRFASGTVKYNAVVRRPGDERFDYPAYNAQVTVNGVDRVPGADGVVTWDGDAAAAITTLVIGPFVRVNNDAGPRITGEHTLAPDATVIWDASDTENSDAQLITFIHANRVKEYVKVLAPEMSWLYDQIRATVNVDSTCNAFSDGDSINFFRAGDGCANTGRLADVVYHEFGHSFHAHAVIPGVGDTEGALGEGAGDYLAATITGDPAMGPGFFNTSAPLRHIDPPDTEAGWPDDISEIHETGRIISGALWDLRKALVAKLGEPDGVTRTDMLFYQGIRRAVDIPSMYVEVLAADDDDGDLANGTPNACEINAAFALHGLRALTTEITPLAAETPDLDGFHVGLNVMGLSAECEGDGIASARIEWQLRDVPAQSGNVDMTGDGGQFTGVIPIQPEGSVVQYKVVVEYLNEITAAYPENPADPRYEFFVGTVEPLYCTDFENDPEADGWSHGLTSGEATEGADDWQWDAPAGQPGSGDPAAAFSGQRVYGNDLGHDNFNGSYQSNKVNFALSPRVSVANYTDVRLQYWRWLNVEDGFFDQASIFVNDQLAWQNQNSDQGDTSSLHHRDKEWRFHDVPLGGAVVDGEVQVRFEIASDGGLEMGGWTIDDFCIVAYNASICGDGNVTGVETCDDGAGNSDSAADACRTDCRPAGCGDSVTDSGEDCDDGNVSDADACTSTCTWAPSVDGDEQPSDCGCRVGAAPRPHTGVGLLVLAFAAAWLVSRRRRGRVV